MYTGSLLHSHVFQFSVKMPQCLFDTEEYVQRGGMRDVHFELTNIRSVLLCI